MESHISVERLFNVGNASRGASNEQRLILTLDLLISKSRCSVISGMVPDSLGVCNRAQDPTLENLWRGLRSSEGKLVLSGDGSASSASKNCLSATSQPFQHFVCCL